jgi:hypothetical protein
MNLLKKLEQWFDSLRPRTQRRLFKLLFFPLCGFFGLLSPFIFLFYKAKYRSKLPWGTYFIGMAEWLGEIPGSYKEIKEQIEEDCKDDTKLHRILK